jgi:phosphoribosylglycinamide formyltransferase 1
VRVRTPPPAAEAAPGDPAGGTPSLRVAVLASGRGSNFAALAAARNAGALPIDLVGVFSDRPAAPVLQRAADLGVPAQAFAPKAFAGREAFEAALFAAVDAAAPALIVCAGYMRLLGAAPVARWQGRMINIHPSLLPRHRGLHTHQRALEAGETEHGASVHFVTAELDGGPVISQVRVPVLPGDDVVSLSGRVLAREHPLLLASVALFATRRLQLRDAQVLLDGQPLAQPLQLTADNHLIRTDRA